MLPVSAGTGRAADVVPARMLRAKASEAYAQQTKESLAEELILEHLPLVRHIVHKVTAQLMRKADLEDLISAGTLGLVKAARAFDPTKDAEFKTYAYIRVRGAVIDELRTRSFVPSSVHGQVQRIRKGYRKCIARNGVPPTDDELAAAVGISTAQLYRSLEEARKQHFLSIHGLTDDEPTVGYLVPPDRSPSPAAQVERKELLERLTQAIKELPKRDRLVLMLYYERDLTMKEASQVLGITESRVSQVHASAIFKLAMKLRTES